MVDKYARICQSKGSEDLPGAYVWPVDLTNLMAEEQGLNINDDYIRGAPKSLAGPAPHVALMPWKECGKEGSAWPALQYDRGTVSTSIQFRREEEVEGEPMGMRSKPRSTLRKRGKGSLQTELHRGIRRSNAF